jgi:O-antigen/teichoic acid export membrane protein
MYAGRKRFGAPDTSVRTRHLHDLLGNAWPAVLALFLVAVLQNIDVVLVKREIGGDAAGAYAAAAVAAKAIIWIAIGVGLWLLPEATRRMDRGDDPRPVLLRALAVVGALAAPLLAIYAVMPGTVLRLAFGADTVQAADALFVLGVAMTLLAAGYLCVQYMLALGRLAFLYALGAVAAAEVALLSGVELSSLGAFAAVVLVLQAVAALATLGLGLSRPMSAPR